MREMGCSAIWVRTWRKYASGSRAVERGGADQCIEGPQRVRPPRSEPAKR